jgi:allantoinase
MSRTDDQLVPPARQAFRSTRVVTRNGVLPATIFVEGEQIAALHPWDAAPTSIPLHDFGDHVILPGLVDTHVHINDPGRDWEGFRTATQAAASGGVTTLVDMPLNSLPETLNIAALEAKRAAAQGNVFVDWAAWGGIVGNHAAPDNLTHIPELAAAGLPGFKVFLVHSGIDTFAWTDEPRLRQALAVLEETGLPLLAHAELAEPIAEATAQLANSDWRSYPTYLASRPDQSELAAIELLIRLAADFQTPIHIVHLATAQALPALRRAREASIPITVETCPQYLWFSGDEIPDGATQYKCAPPIRDAANREALWAALREGLIDFVATDHSPCPPALKLLDPSLADAGRFDRAWGGIASLGLALPILYTGLSRRFGSADSHFSDIARWLSTAPARLASLTGRKGAIAPGHHADFAIFDPGLTWTVAESDLHFRHKISPYLGAQLHGRVTETWLRGRRIFHREGGQSQFAPIPHGQELRIRS